MLLGGAKASTKALQAEDPSAEPGPGGAERGRLLA